MTALVDIPPLHSWSALPGMVTITHLWMLVGTTGTASTDGWTSRRSVAIYMDCICQYSLQWCLDSIYAMEIIHAEYLKGLLQSQSRNKMYNRSFLSIGKSNNDACMYLYLESYTKLPVLRGCIHNQGGLKIRRLLCEYSRGISFL